MALDKNPRVRLIGIGEVLRRIIGRSIIQCIKTDLIFLGGNSQLWARRVALNMRHTRKDISFQRTET